MIPYENLANAIVVRAAKDYRAILRYLKKNPRNSTAALEKDSLEKFFRSEFYRNLTNVDGEMLLSRLRKEVRS